MAMSHYFFAISLGHFLLKGLILVLILKGGTVIEMKFSSTIQF